MLRLQRPPPTRQGLLSGSSQSYLLDFHCLLPFHRRFPHHPHQEGEVVVAVVVAGASLAARMTTTPAALKAQRNPQAVPKSHKHLLPRLQVLQVLQARLQLETYAQPDAQYANSAVAKQLQLPLQDPNGKLVRLC